MEDGLCKGISCLQVDIHTYYDKMGYNRSKSQAVSPYVTLLILIGGVVGGLAIVIAFILFCKYCVKRKGGTMTRDQGTDCERTSDRRFKPFQRYETINSDMFSEPSTGSMDGMPISPRKLFDTKSHDMIPGIEEANETTRLNSDFEKSSFCETTVEPETQDSTTADGDAVYGSSNDIDENEAAEDKDSGRRVSFQLDNLQHSPTGYLRKGRRYTEGDFHYLKKVRINTDKVPRQYSLGTPLQRDRDMVIEAPQLERRTRRLHSNPTCYTDPPPASNDRINDSYVTDHGYMLETQCCKTVSEIPAKVVDVDVEVHEPLDLPIIEKYSRKIKNSYSYSTRSPKSALKMKALQPTSHSMDIMHPSDKETNTAECQQKRRVKSYDDVLTYDYDVLNITEFSRGPYYNSEFDPIMEVDALGSSKVRYNDMGSLEVLNEDKLDSFDEFEFENNIIPDESDADTETTLNGNHKFRELWNLRATYEEEEECSDTIRMEDMASADDSSSERGCDGGISYSPTYHIKHKEATAHYNQNNVLNYKLGANRQPDTVNRSPVLPGGSPAREDPEKPNLLHPNYENNIRRDDFRKVVNRRYQKHGSISAENSFDSYETGDTDGDATESSRHEVTTSFESTTDNTDSTNDSQTSRLRQMKADSGYKSMETQQPPGLPNGTKKAYSMDDEIIVLGSEITPPSPPKHNEVLEATGTNESVPRRGSLLEKRRGRTASKRRREYSRERQIIRLNDACYDPETDSARSDQQSGESYDEPNTPSSKPSVFSRFFKSHKSREKGLSRDFSIDKKSNSLFQEFVRFDPKFEPHRASTVGIGFTSRRHRLQRKYTDPGPSVFSSYEDRKWLSPDMRSTSLGSDSSASSARRISPHDSIEEELGEEDAELEDEEVEEEDIDAAVLHHKNTILALQSQHLHAQNSISGAETISPNTSSLQDIPIIKLPEEELVANI